MSEFVFEKFRKISRLKRDCTITEKIDGTNAQILFNEEGYLLVGSRQRQIWPEGYEGKPKGCDNYGFAKWVYENKQALWEFLGPGRHFGEWAGQGIQRRYGLDMKRFFLFNTARFGSGRQEIPEELSSIGLDVVPVLYEGEFTTTAIDDAMRNLRGLSYVNGFNNPEGIIVYHHALRDYFKVTFENDRGKWNERLP